jgi:superfamily II DNA helicase RecQ
MARVRPLSVDALLAVKGVGARKAGDLGEQFLAAIREHNGADVQAPRRL